MKYHGEKYTSFHFDFETVRWWLGDTKRNASIHVTLGITWFKRGSNEEGSGTRHLLLQRWRAISNLVQSILSILNMYDQEIMIIASWDDLIWRSFKELSLLRVVHDHFFSWAIALEGNQTLQETTEWNIYDSWICLEIRLHSIFSYVRNELMAPFVN